MSAAILEGASQRAIPADSSDEDFEGETHAPKQLPLEPTNPVSCTEFPNMYARVNDVFCGLDPDEYHPNPLSQTQHVENKTAKEMSDDKATVKPTFAGGLDMLQPTEDDLMVKQAHANEMVEEIDATGSGDSLGLCTQLVDAKKMMRSSHDVVEARPTRLQARAR